MAIYTILQYRIIIFWQHGTVLLVKINIKHAVFLLKTATEETTKLVRRFNTFTSLLLKYNLVASIVQQQFIAMASSYIVCVIPNVLCIRRLRHSTFQRKITFDLLHFNGSVPESVFHTLKSALISRPIEHMYRLPSKIDSQWYSQQLFNAIAIRLTSCEFTSL